jgi:hypothetical protein
MRLFKMDGLPRVKGDHAVAGVGGYLLADMPLPGFNIDDFILQGKYG